MMNIGQNELPVKCWDPDSVKRGNFWFPKCTGKRPEWIGGPCMFVCGAYCGADAQDFVRKTTETEYTDLFKEGD